MSLLNIAGVPVGILTQAPRELSGAPEVGRQQVKGVQGGESGGAVSPEADEPGEGEGGAVLTPNALVSALTGGVPAPTPPALPGE